LYRITIINYQDWFKQAVTYWLQTFRQEGIRRVVKALDIEKDVCVIDRNVTHRELLLDWHVFTRISNTTSASAHSLLPTQMCF